MVNPAAADVWLMPAACALAAAWALWKFAACIRRDRLLADTPLVKIRSAAQGYVKVRGRAGCAEAESLAAPLSGRACVWYSYRLDCKVTDARGRSTWNRVENGSSVRPFLLADAGGTCLVGPVNAEITPTSHEVWYGTSPRPGSAPTRRSLFGNAYTYRYEERLLKIGDALSVTGELRSNFEAAGADAAAAALLRRWKADQAGLLARFDNNHDGRIDAAEWDAARHAAAAESEHAAGAAPPARVSVIGQPTHGEPFLIASMETPRLVWRERLHSLGFLAAGMSCCGLCVWSAQHPQLLAGLLRAMLS